MIILRKSYNKGYTRKDGTTVAPFTDKRVSAPAPAPGKHATKHPSQGGLFGGYGFFGGSKGHSGHPAYPSKLFVGPIENKHPNKINHPALDDAGEKMSINVPEKSTPAATWADPDAVAVYGVGDAGQLPDELFGVHLAPWIDHPEGDDWDYVDGQMDDLFEPAIHVPKGKKAASGVVIEEEDGRVWVVSPTNHFGGYQNVFPKGKAEEELSLQANAIKEAFEESGLKVEITGFIGDFERTSTVARMYSARRVGGTPADVGWESQAVKLAPKSHLVGLLDSLADDEIIRKISQ